MLKWTGKSPLAVTMTLVAEKSLERRGGNFQKRAYQFVSSAKETTLKTCTSNIIHTEQHIFIYIPVCVCAHARTHVHATVNIYTYMNAIKISGKEAMDLEHQEF